MFRKATVLQSGHPRKLAKRSNDVWERSPQPEGNSPIDGAIRASTIRGWKSNRGRNKKGTFRIVMARLANMALEGTRDGCTSSRRYKFSAEFLVNALYPALGTLAVVVGIWAGSRVWVSHPFRNTSLAWRVGAETRPWVASVKSASDGLLLTEYVPLGSMQIEDNFFAVIVEQAGIIRQGSAIRAAATQKYLIAKVGWFGATRRASRMPTLRGSSTNSCDCPTVNLESISRRTIQSTSNVGRPDALVDVVSADFALPTRPQTKVGWTLVSRSCDKSSGWFGSTQSPQASQGRAGHSPPS